MARKTDIFFNAETVWKTPTEIVRYRDFDFVDDIPASDSIRAMGGASSTTIKAFDTSGADVTSTIIGFQTVSGTKLHAELKNGTDGQDFVIVATAEMTTSVEKIEKFLKLKVRAIPKV